MKETDKKGCAERGRPIEQMTPSMLINQIARLFEGRLRAKSERAGMAAGYRQILFFLAHDGALTQRELTERTKLRAPTVSVALQKMESEGLVQRKGDSEDQRKISVTLTEKGRQMDDMLRFTCEDNERRMVEGFTETEIEVLKSALRKVYSNLQKAYKEES